MQIVVRVIGIFIMRASCPIVSKLIRISATANRLSAHAHPDSPYVGIAGLRRFNK